MFPLLIGWLILINFVAFFLMWQDKRRAQRSQWRISEKTLFLPPLLGGALGGILSMNIFRHKTQHWYFVWGFPIILVAQIFLAILIYCKFLLNV